MRPHATPYFRYIFTNYISPNGINLKLKLLFYSCKVECLGKETYPVLTVGYCENNRCCGKDWLWIGSIFRFILIFILDPGYPYEKICYRKGD